MATSLSFEDHVGVLAEVGDALREAAARAGLDAPVPTCPGWTVRDLVTHQGAVHRWASANLQGVRGSRPSDFENAAAAAPDLLDWYAAGFDELLRTLRSTPEDVEALVFLNDAPPPLRFWARRQAHETAIHCADALAAVHGAAPSAAELKFGTAFAVDGIDELLHGSITRGNGKLNASEPFAIVVAPDDDAASWTVRVEERSLTTVDGSAADAAAVLSGDAAQLYLGLWNRGDEMTVSGRPGILDLWRAEVRVG